MNELTHIFDTLNHRPSYFSPIVVYKMTSNSRKKMIEMDRTAVSIKGVLDDIRTQISILDDDIKVS